jgi:hypothetical protein
MEQHPKAVRGLGIKPAASACASGISQEGVSHGLNLSFSAEQEPATVEQAAEVFRVIVSTTTLQNSISVEILLEVLMEIIAEESPSGLALNLTRKSIRNEMVFAPSPKEFRDSLLRARCLSLVRNGRQSGRRIAAASSHVQVVQAVRS